MTITEEQRELAIEAMTASAYDDMWRDDIRWLQNLLLGTGEVQWFCAKCGHGNAVLGESCANCGAVRPS